MTKCKKLLFFSLFGLLLSLTIPNAKAANGRIEVVRVVQVAKNTALFSSPPVLVQVELRVQSEGVSRPFLAGLGQIMKYGQYYAYIGSLNNQREDNEIMPFHVSNRVKESETSERCMVWLPATTVTSTGNIIQATWSGIFEATVAIARKEGGFLGLGTKIVYESLPAVSISFNHSATMPIN